MVTCGDGRAQTGEACDLGDLSGATCMGLGFQSGNLTCFADCTGFDTSGCAGPADNLIINELRTRGDDEIELHNGGDLAVGLAGFFLATGDYDPADPSTEAARSVLEPGMSIGARAYLVLSRPADHDLDLDPAGGGVRLFDPTGTVVDQVAYVSGEANRSYCRIPDLTGPFRPCATPTFGGPNTALAPVVLNEISSIGDDRIEILNRSDNALDLSGWQVTTGAYDPLVPATFDQRHDLPADTVLAFDRYLVLAKGVDHTFEIESAGRLALRDAEGAIIDEIGWIEGAADPAFCRRPDGTGAWLPCPSATFGASND